MLRDRIATEIARSGPMPFDRFMEIALYDGDGGFFGSGGLRSHRGGDFLTSPEISPLFGETLARFVSAESDRLGGLDAVIDCGAGSGTLLAALRSAHPALPLWAVEVSPAARAALEQRVAGVGVVDSLAGLPRLERAVIVANELVDNLPAAVAVRTAVGWEEEMVGVEGDHLVAVPAPARPEVVEWADRFAPGLPAGSRVEVQLAAFQWLGEVLRLFSAGAVAIFDYGDTSEGLISRRRTGTLRTYRAHHLGPDPLLEPGATDITLDVDFDALAAAARQAGAEVEYLTQSEFLTAWGLRDRLSELRHAELDAARRGATMERLEARSRITEAETLLHPRGLGDFRVLVARPAAGIGPTGATSPRV